MDVGVVDASRRQFLEVFERRSGRWRHDQVGPFGVSAHPVDVRAVACDGAMLNDAFGVSLSLVADVMSVDGKADGEVSDLDGMVDRIAHSDGPDESVARGFEGLRSLEVVDR